MLDRQRRPFLSKTETVFLMTRHYNTQVSVSKVCSFGLLLIRPVVPLISVYSWRKINESNRVNCCGYLYIVIVHLLIYYSLFFTCFLSCSRASGPGPGPLQWGASQGPGFWLHRAYRQLHPRQRAPQCQDHCRRLYSSQGKWRHPLIPAL